MLGIQYLDLSLLGKLGIDEGRLHVPLLGGYALMDFYLWDDYRANFFEGGTWHLLWPLMLVSLLCLPLLPAGAGRRAIIALVVVMAAAQSSIFEGTIVGQWAEEWTAINRLPLHFAPSLVFALALIAHHVTQRATG
jgi:hypothetical protein